MHAPAPAAPGLASLLDAQHAIARLLCEDADGALVAVLALACRTLGCTTAAVWRDLEDPAAQRPVAAWPTTARPADPETDDAVKVALELGDEVIGALVLQPAAPTADRVTLLWVETVAAQLAQHLARVEARGSPRRRDHGLAAPVAGADRGGEAEGDGDHRDLIGLNDPASMAQALARAAARAARDDVRAALVVLDLDAFTQLNDTRGRAVGGRVLRLAADRLRAAAGPDDLLVHRGGDTFLLLICDLEPRAATHRALAVAERLRLAVAEPMPIDGELLHLRASLGLSVLGADARDPAEAMRHADTAMHRAKRVTRGGVWLYRETGSPAPAPGLHAASLLTRAPAAARRAAALDEVLSQGGLRAVYQPIVDLDTGDVVAYEALARGPVGSPMALPEELFAAAREARRVPELDWACRAAALQGALDAGLPRPRRLFVNVEVDALALPTPDALQALLRRAGPELDVIVEITERALTERPADLLRLVRDVRARGWGIALDDVGADVRALAIMPLVRPDVIKLDLRLLHDNPTTEIAEIIQAVNAECERTGALVLAEGIETEEHVASARAMGAHLGQGWHLGRPGPLEVPAAPPARAIELAVVPDPGAEVSPYEIVRQVREVRRGDKSLMFAISLQLEQQASAIGEAALILSAFQHAEHFTPLTAERYAVLAADAAFVAALGVGMPAEPARGVRGAALRDDDPLKAEWSVVVLGPHFAAALVAMDLGHDEEGRELGFDFAITYDRRLVIDAAAALMRRMEPLSR